MVEGCPQAWHVNLAAELPRKLLMECQFHAGHRGQRHNEDSTMSWSGKLTDAEMKQAEELRSAAVGG